MVNINKLKGKIVERGLTVEEVAVQMGIHKASLYRKLKRSADSMLIKEANTLVQILGLNAEEAIAIFFTDVVA